MAFLDNSGDILLDAVLTDAGRKRMAMGTFRITKFALADDEINYTLYNANDTRGSAYYDLDILSTPVLEAFTDNMSGLKSKLLSIPRTDLLYLPVIKLFEGNTRAQTNDSGSFYVLANTDATAVPFDNGTISTVGILGENVSADNVIALDQGIDNTARPYSTDIAADLLENQYIIEMDDRLLRLIEDGDGDTTTVQEPAYIDDDNKSSYFVTSQNANFVYPVPNGKTQQAASSIAGSRGTRLRFKLWTSSDLDSSNNLFLKLGATVVINGETFYYIDTNVRVMGATTGYRIDIPVRILKK